MSNHNSKKYFIPILLISLFSLSFFSVGKDEIRVMTYNIRYANNNPGEEWSERRELVAEMIRFHKPDIFGVQEAVKLQIDFLADKFPNYKWVGVGRDDGKYKGEYSAIFVSERFKIIDGGTFWLSETPDIPSLGWDASFNRIATWCKLTDTSNRDTFFIFNTHLDHMGVIARINSAKLLTELPVKIADNSPMILMGDFNSTDTTEVYSILTGIHAYQDALSISENIYYGTNDTFNGFGQDTIHAKIDYIFVKNGFRIFHHAVIGDKFEGRYPSDHMPVIADLIAE